MDVDSDEGLLIQKVRDPKYFKPKIHPKKLCTNCQTGRIDVSESFFDIVWNEYQNDNSWKSWVCLNQEKEVIGVVILQTFVHDSNYFRWGSPLDDGTQQPKRTGEIDDVVEISFFCAKGCGGLLLEHVLKWVADSSTYKWVVVNSTVGAQEWYERRGFETVVAYRLPRKTRGNEHLYRHRISDEEFDRDEDAPSLMLYKPIVRLSNT